jgi:hypothetical protein
VSAASESAAGLASELLFPVDIGNDETNKQLGMRLTFLAVWLFPGVVALCGGALSCLTHYLVSPRAAGPKSETAGYRVIAGRLTAITD